MTPAETPAELELLALADPCAAIDEARALAAAGCPVEWRESVLRVLRPWWSSETDPRPMARLVGARASMTEIGSPEHRRSALLSCLLIRAAFDVSAIGVELSAVESWAWGGEERRVFIYEITAFAMSNPANAASDAEHISDAAVGSRPPGDIAFFGGLADLIRAAIPLETLVP